MISDDKITTIYFIVDEFFKEFNQVLIAKESECSDGCVCKNDVSKKMYRHFFHRFNTDKSMSYQKRKTT